MQKHDPKREGIRVRHQRSCGSPDGRPCNCRPSYQAHAHAGGQRVFKAFPTLAAAKAWRRDALTALERGTMRSPSSTTVREAADAWIAGVRDGSVRSRKGEPYKPSAIRGYERCLRRRVVPALGHVRVSELGRRHVQAFVDGMVAEGLDPATIRNTLNPLQAMYRRAVQREEVAVNPTTGLDVPRVTNKRERIASPKEAARLIEALPSDDRAVWATALYAGLRRGELRALRWTDVDLATGVIRVERGWDDEEGEIEGKTRAARRTVPIAVALRDHLVEHGMRRGREGLVFGTSPTLPMQPSNVRRRAKTAWKAAKLEGIGLHECRHTFASLMIAAGVNAKALATYMGHASVAITFDRYGHLMPGNEVEAAGLLDAYLARSVGGPGSLPDAPEALGCEPHEEKPVALPNP